MRTSSRAWPRWVAGTRFDHVIVGPGVEGPDTRHGLAAAVGVDSALGRLPNPDDLLDVRDWLAWARAG